MEIDAIHYSSASLSTIAMNYCLVCQAFVFSEITLANPTRNNRSLEKP
jgi:hypothetical protein